MDIPADMRVTLLPNAPNPFGVLRSKGKNYPSLSLIKTNMYFTDSGPLLFVKNSNKNCRMTVIFGTKLMTSLANLCPTQHIQLCIKD